jgi:hypothetical protein
MKDKSQNKDQESLDKNLLVKSRKIKKLSKKELEQASAVVVLKEKASVK